MRSRKAHPEVADSQRDQQVVGCSPKPLVPIEGGEDNGVSGDGDRR